MPVSLPTELSTWQFEPLTAVPVIMLACCYLAALEGGGENMPRSGV